jgi:hypothetical protein
MELKINLLEIHKKSWWRILFGFVFILITLIWLFAKIGNDQTISAFDWIYFSAMLLNGVFHTFWGLGYSVYKYFGNAHIIVDAEKISVKPTITAKNQSIRWDDVQSIFYKSNGFRIIRNNGAIFNLTLEDLDYSHINKIKETVKHIAKSRKVNYE